MPTVEAFTAVINQLLPEPHAGLLAGMTWGVRRSMPAQFYQQLLDTGTVHVIALSGQNIVIIMHLVARMTLWGFSRRISSLLTIIFIVLFILFVGADPPVVRAGLMGGLSLIAVYFGKMNWSLLSLVLAAAAMLLVRPDWLDSLSFQLSFAATLGIMLFGGQSMRTKYSFLQNKPSDTTDRLTGHYKNLLYLARRTLGQDLRLTLAAQVFTIPIILLRLGRVSLIAPLSNILVGWTVPIITILGIAISAIGWVWIPPAQLLAWIAWVPLEFFVQIVRLTGSIPFASVAF